MSGLVQFPSFYPDELVYSLLARYYQRSGYMRYTFTAEDLFQSKVVRPDIDFVNLYTSDAFEMLTREIPFEIVIEKHTMFPFYGRFLPIERKQSGFKALVSMDANCKNHLAIPKKKAPYNRYLRYCPKCVEADREMYGETYWHRQHQIADIGICPVHRCILIDSEVLIAGNVSPDLVCAEYAIPLDVAGSIEVSNNEIQYRLSKYVVDVFQKPVDLENDAQIGKFLHYKMENTQYRTVRGGLRNMSLFCSDFATFYRDLPHNDFCEDWQIQKILNGYKYNCYEICMLSMFLGIFVDELCNAGKCKLPEQTQEQTFDREIHRLHEQGLNYAQIANRLNGSYDTVKAIGEGSYQKNNRRKRTNMVQTGVKCGVKSPDWEQVDRDTLVLVRDAIDKIHDTERKGDRPQRISCSVIEKALGLPSNRIGRYLPLCRAEIGKWSETQEQYWSREIVWAVHEVDRCSDEMNWRKIRDLTNMRKRDLIRCLGEIRGCGDEYVVAVLESLV